MRELVDIVLDTGRISYGPMSRELEARFASIHECRHAVLSNSGTSSLQVALQAMKEMHGWEDGDEVIVPSVTFVATINVVLHNKMKPVLVDVEPDYYGIDVSKIEDAITDRTRAIIPVHLFGMPCDMAGVVEVACNHNLKIIEDSCFTGNTLIPTKEGQKRIKDIEVGDRLLGFNGITFQETIVTDTMDRLVDFRDLLIIKFENGLTVRCTKEHPFYVDGEWTKACDLAVDDEVWQCGWSEYTSWRREYNLSEEGRKIISEKMKKNNPSYDPDTIRRSATNRVHSISGIEKRVIQTCEEYLIPIDYVGDGALWIGADDDAYKNPDFVVRGEKIVLEVYDPTFQYHCRRNVPVERDDAWRKERADFFSKYGYRTEFIELSGFVSRKERAGLAKRLRKIVSNGVKIVSIKQPKKGFIKRYNSGKDEPDGMVRVYNLHCEPHNNFILSSGVLVHNCETMFVRHQGRMTGAWSHIACFSMYVAHLLTAGVGGIAITNDPLYAVKMRSLVNHGRDGIYISIDDDDGLDNSELREVVERRFHFEAIGHSYRITELEAALALAQLDDWEDMIRARQNNASLLSLYLRGLQDKIQLPALRPNTESAHMMFPIVVREESKWGLCQHLEKNGIETREMLRLTDQPAYEGLWNPRRYPIAVWLNDCGFYVGIHQALDATDMSYIAKTIGAYFGR